VYHLTISAKGVVIRKSEHTNARQALMAWFEEEATGYDVVCKDIRGRPVTRGQLRVESRTVSTGVA
jgi:hypothetical protein